jgi:hypothetical protein
MSNMDSSAGEIGMPLLSLVKLKMVADNDGPDESAFGSQCSLTVSSRNSRSTLARESSLSAADKQDQGFVKVN